MQEHQWAIAGASVKGVSHARDGLPNQDYWDRWPPTNGATLPAIVAIADGHGASRHFRSADGARIAVDVTLNVLRKFAPQLDEADEAGRERLALTEIPTRIVEQWTEAARSDLKAKPISDDEWRGVEAGEGAAALASVRANQLLAYGATLLAALVTDRCTVLTQLGDGDILAVDSEGKTTRPLPADERLADNFTTSICRPGAENDFRAKVLDAGRSRPALLVLSTDGYANSFRTDADFLQVGRDFLDLLRKNGVASVQDQLRSILEHASSNGSGDDITLGLLLCLASDEPPVERAARPTRVPETPSAHEADPMRTNEHRTRSELVAAEQRILVLKRSLAVAAAVALVAVGWATRQHFGGQSPTQPHATQSALGDAARKPAPATVKEDPGAPTEERNINIEATAHRTQDGIEIHAVLSQNSVHAGPCKLEGTVLGQRGKLAVGPSKSFAPDQGPIDFVVPYPNKAEQLRGATVSLLMTCNGKPVAERGRIPVTERKAVAEGNA